MSRRCQIVEVDGEQIRVQADAELDDRDREMFAELVRAAKRRLEAESSDAS